MKWKILCAGVIIALIVTNNSIGNKEKPFLSKNEITDFLISLGIDEKTISTMNISDVYLSDIPDDFWSRMNMSKKESAKLIKDIIQQTFNQAGALEKLVELFPVEEQKPILTFGPETLEELKIKSGVIAVYGKIPKFDTQEERWEWLDKLGEIDRKTAKILIEQYGYPKGPVVMYGVGEGYLLLSIYEKYKINEDLLNEIYSKIDFIAKSIGITNIPMVIEKSSQLGMMSEAGRVDKYRPIRGGIQIVNNAFGWWESTLGWAARRGTTKGYVVSGHLGYNPYTGYDEPTPIGMPIYQPDYPDQAGMVLECGGEYSDAAFVTFDNVAPYIYTVPYGYHLGIVTQYGDPSVNTQVYMSGIASDWTTGLVKYQNVTIYTHAHGWLYEQMLATYPSNTGDSGAPVLNWGREILPGLAFVKVYGVHAGYTYRDGNRYAVFSPQSGVYTDMDVTPLRIGE